MADRPAHAVTRLMTTERQNAKEMAARPAHAVTRLMTTECQNAKETAARPAHAVTRLMATERQNAKETAARPAHALTRLMTTERQDAKETAPRSPHALTRRLSTLRTVARVTAARSPPAPSDGSNGPSCTTMVRAEQAVRSRSAVMLPNCRCGAYPVVDQVDERRRSAVSPIRRHWEGKDWKSLEGGHCTEAALTP